MQNSNLYILKTLAIILGKLEYNIQQWLEWRLTEAKNEPSIFFIAKPYWIIIGEAWYTIFKFMFKM